MAHVTKATMACHDMTTAIKSLPTVTKSLSPVIPDNFSSLIESPTDKSTNTDNTNNNNKNNNEHTTDDCDDNASDDDTYSNYVYDSLDEYDNYAYGDNDAYTC